MWNQDLPLSFTQKWNPFDKSIPMLTFMYHPLFYHKGKLRKYIAVDMVLS